MLLTAGVGLVILIMLDVIWSTLTIRGSGPVTRPLMKALQALLKCLHRRASRIGILSAAGPLAILTLGAVWVGGAWMGWTLIFSAFPEAVVEGQTGTATDAVGRLYFVGFALSTLGVGDLEPDSHLAQILTNIAAFNGLALVTLIIAYALPMVSGAIGRRTLAYTISTQGSSPADLVLQSWNGKNFQALESLLTSLASDLLQNAEQHLAYPIVAHFHSREPGGSMGLQVAILDEALSLLTFGLDGPQRPDPVVLSRARRAVRHYLERVARDFNGPPSEIPPLPDLQALHSLTGPDLQLKPADVFAEAMASQAEHRRMLLLMVRNEGWEWPRALPCA